MIFRRGENHQDLKQACAGQGPERTNCGDVNISLTENIPWQGSAPIKCEGVAPPTMYGMQLVVVGEGKVLRKTFLK